MPEHTQHWTASLFDSVYALHETAREFQTAHRAAQLAVQTVDFDRRQLHAGRIEMEGRTNAYGRTFTRAPHKAAASILTRLYSTTESTAHRYYEGAALLYASGAAWAIRTVQDGGTPPAVAFQLDDDGDPLPHAMNIPGLVTYAGGPALDAAYDRVRTCMDSAEHAEDLAGRDYVSEHEAGEMFRAGDVASGLAESAFAYGLLAQRALNGVLREPRRARERELAAARATAQQTAQPAN